MFEKLINCTSFVIKHLTTLVTNFTEESNATSRLTCTLQPFDCRYYSLLCVHTLKEIGLRKRILLDKNRKRSWIIIVDGCSTKNLFFSNLDISPVQPAAFYYFQISLLWNINFYFMKYTFFSFFWASIIVSASLLSDKN